MRGSKTKRRHHVSDSVYNSGRSCFSVGGRGDGGGLKGFQRGRGGEEK